MYNFYPDFRRGGHKGKNFQLQKSTLVSDKHFYEQH